MPAVWNAVSTAGISVNKLRKHFTYLQKADPDIESQRFVVTFDGTHFGASAFDLLDIGEVASAPERVQSLIVRVSLLTPHEELLLREIEEFEWLLNKPRLAEADMQSFFEHHPNFLLGLEYKTLRSQLTLKRVDASDLRPDFFMERVDMPLMDIAELKLPSARLTAGISNRRRFSSSVFEALAQLREYHKYFEDSANRRWFTKTYGLDAYKPRLYAIIGRSTDFASPIERRDLESELGQVRVLTYDDLMYRAKRRLEISRTVL